MRVQFDERMPASLKRHGLRAPAAEDLGGHDRTRSDSVPDAESAPVPSDRHAAYALLAEQCRRRVDALAPRQRDVLAGLIAGHSNKQIAHVLGISPRTIEMYRAGMMTRLNARTLAQALHIAFVAGLVPSDTISLGSG